jgi:hypothetical protein
MATLTTRAFISTDSPLRRKAKNRTRGHHVSSLWGRKSSSGA